MTSTFISAASLGIPLQGCLITATRKQSLPGIDSWSRLSADNKARLTFTANTDAKGKYLIPVPRGEWFVGVRPPDNTMLSAMPLSRVVNAEPIVDEVRLDKAGGVKVLD
jgi:hypothetical protein